ncbi:MAG: hypothetical protein IJM50_04905 [Lachnospiraceae bacterium]|nr:hypothetical protein [Lachnospiraceae bacterium]
MSLTQLHLYSSVLRLETEVWAVLPDMRAFDRPEKKFKVLWLMPSGSQDQTDWIRHSDIENMAKERDLVVFSPDLHKSCGTNMYMGPRYADFVAKELPETLRTMFRFLSDKRDDNYIAGFSNGAYAALYTAMTYPECYVAASGFASGDKADADWPHRPWTQRVPNYGPGTDESGDFKNTPYSYKYLAKKLVENNSPFIPHFFHVWGLAEHWTYMNDIVRDFFLSYKDKGDPFCYEYLALEGCGHDFRMCEQGLQGFFDYLKLPVIDIKTREVKKTFE